MQIVKRASGTGPAAFGIPPYVLRAAKWVMCSHRIRGTDIRHQADIWREPSCGVTRLEHPPL